MGKIKKARQKFHISAPKIKSDINTSRGDDLKEPKIGSTTETPITVGDNIFAGIKINLDSLNNKLSDDTRSVRSFKSVKSELGIKQVSKKDKLKLRKEVLLKKIDTVQQMKKESKKRKKRKKVAIIGDTNPLHDALPDLQSLLKSTGAIKAKREEQKAKPKAICTAVKRKKEMIKNIGAFKTLMKDKQFQKNPLATITSHLQAKVKQL